MDAAALRRRAVRARVFESRVPPDLHALHVLLRRHDGHAVEADGQRGVLPQEGQQRATHTGLGLGGEGQMEEGYGAMTKCECGQRTGRGRKFSREWYGGCWTYLDAMVPAIPARCSDVHHTPITLCRTPCAVPYCARTCWSPYMSSMYTRMAWSGWAAAYVSYLQRAGKGG